MIETNIIVKYYFLQHSWKKVRTVVFQSPYDELVAMGLSFNNKADNYKISLSKDLRTIEKIYNWKKTKYHVKLLYEEINGLFLLYKNN